MTDKKIQGIFDANPKAKAVYVASDGMPFINKYFAKNHQSSLNKRKGGEKEEYKTYTRDGLKKAAESAKKSTEPNLDELKKEAEALKIAGFENMPKKLLIEQIAKAKKAE